MAKNWVLFIAIFTVSYGGMFYLQFQRDAKYRAEKAVYEKKLAAWQDAQALAKQTKEKALEDLRRAASTPVEPAPTAAQTTTESPTLTNVPSLSNVDEQRALLSNPLRDDVKRIEVETPLYRVVFSELGAVPINWEIKSSDYVRNIQARPDGTPIRDKAGAIMTSIELIPSAAGDPDSREFPLQFAGSTAIDFNRTFFKTTEEKTATGRTITFRGERDGMEAVKVFTFSNDSYVVGLKATITNNADARRKLGRDEGWGIGWQGGLGTPDIADRLHGMVNVVAAVGEEVRTRHLTRDGAALTIPAAVAWAGLEKKFFTALLVPSTAPGTAAPISVDGRFNPRNDAIDYKTSGANVPPSMIIFHPGVELEKGQTASLAYNLYVGPKSREALRAADLPAGTKAANPVQVVFHSMPLGFTWVRPLTIWLLNLMRWLHEHLAPLTGPGAWGLAIIATTLCVRTLIYPLTHWNVKAQVRTMMEQQRIRPDLEVINKKYAKDPVERNKAVMQLYRDHNINPLGVLRGCVPALLQMPIFLALYVVFEQSVELRAQPFLWILDLSGPDALVAWTSNLPLIGHSFNVLPLLMAATNFYLMKMMQQPAQDELQQQIQNQMMFMMPIMFLFFLYHLPSGLILYWIVSNSISILQNYVTKKILAKEMARHEADKAAGLLPGKPVAKGLSDAKA